MTTTQLKQTAASHVTGATASVTNASPTVTDSASGFVATDVGRAITTTSTSGKVVSSVTNAGTMVMDGNATASTGPQVLTMAPVFTNVTKGTGVAARLTVKSTPFLASLPPGTQSQALLALNVWTITGGLDGQATWAQKHLAAIGLIVQET
jgi:hypothetical protein